MNIKRLFEKTSTGLKEFVAKVDFANVIGLGEELAKYVKKDSDNEANVNYVNSTRDKTLTTGYNGIKYIVVNDEISDVVFNVNDKGVCNSKQFVCSSSLDRTSYNTTINSKSIGIFYNGPFLSKSINISDNSITFSNTSSFGDIEDGGNNTLKTIYSIDNITMQGSYYIVKLTTKQDARLSANSATSQIIVALGDKTDFTMSISL